MLVFGLLGDHPMDYNVVTAARMTDSIEKVNEAIQDGWLPLGGGFQTQHVPSDSVRFMQAMVKVHPWSLKEIPGRIQGATAASLSAIRACGHRCLARNDVRKRPCIGQEKCCRIS